jgi:hypothetical protein
MCARRPALSILKRDRCGRVIDVESVVGRHVVRVGPDSEFRVVVPVFRIDREDIPVILAGWICGHRYRKTLIPARRAIAVRDRRKAADEPALRVVVVQDNRITPAQGARAVRRREAVPEARRRKWPEHHLAGLVEDDGGVVLVLEVMIRPSGAAIVRGDDTHATRAERLWCWRVAAEVLIDRDPGGVGKHLCRLLRARLRVLPTAGHVLQRRRGVMSDLRHRR